jgi:hypothetical protein
MGILFQADSNNPLEFASAEGEGVHESYIGYLQSGQEESAVACKNP